ncbi:uncharacterized protein IL334_002737 [Kwoniella shivajii]|uniref:Elongin-A n=1 Tax=Kwoniella shivajii TaxID=564305 RepID=A0ABZ1CW67_9TREE|nr:hypothetical protein IL334_002737 [Kwoniella shivajii]
MEYEEEDVLDDDGVLQDVIASSIIPVNAAVPISAPVAPIASSSRAVSSSTSVRIYPSIQAGPSTGRVYKNTDDRLRELNDRKRTENEAERKAREGVRSLKSLSISVIKSNSERIWDIGDLEYPLIKPLIDDLPVIQLQEIELHSPHIKKDTDWLYEIFLLQEYPLFHERCQDRHGEPRTSGWRRMYKKAKEDFLVRKSHAADRVAARYKQLEEEKASKRIVVMDRIMPDQKPKSGWGRSKVSSSGGSAGSTSVSKPQNAIAKARIDAQRARVALTHASGRFIPPTPPKPKGDNQLFKNPYLPSSSPSTPAHSSQRPILGPRIPPPKTAQSRRRERVSSPSSPNSPIPGSYPTSESNQVRSSLHSHLKNSPKVEEKREERFKIDASIKKTQFKEIKRPVGEKFVIPNLEKEKSKSKGIVMDFFSSSPTQPSTTTVGGMKRKFREEGDINKDEDAGTRSPKKSISTPHSDPDPHSRAMSTKPSEVPSTTHRPLPAPVSSTMAQDKMNSVLFRKKKVVKQK